MSDDYRPGELGSGFLGLFIGIVTVWFLWIGEYLLAVYAMALMVALALFYTAAHTYDE